MSGTDLDAVLRNLGVTTIVVTGVSVNIAVTNLVMEAVNLGYDVVLPRDAVCGVPADYADAVIDNTLRLLATITTVDELVGVWEAAGRVRFCQSLMFADPSQWVATSCRWPRRRGSTRSRCPTTSSTPTSSTRSTRTATSGEPMFPPDTQWPDVWVTTGALAAVTERIHFSTHVYVLPVRNPFVVAKAVGTAAWLSDDRVVLGVGAGWMREEFAQLEQPFERRGARMEEQIEVLRTLWRGGMVEHHGEFYDFDRLEMAPGARAGSVPILIGGHSDTALRRAARVGDGWMGVYYDTEALKEIVRRLQGFREEYGTTDRPFEIQASIVDRMPTPDVCAELAAEGVTCIITSAWMMQGLQFASLAENVRALESFGEQYIAPLRRRERRGRRHLSTPGPLMGRQN